MHEQDEEIRIANMMTRDWGRFKGPLSASECQDERWGGDMTPVSPGKD